MAKILFLEDEKNLACIACKFLEKEGHEVVWVSNGEEGLKVLQEKGNFDLHICDLSMPKLDGFGFLEALDKLHVEKKNPYRQRLFGN